jgi:hypothetical protein
LIFAIPFLALAIVGDLWIRLLVAFGAGCCLLGFSVASFELWRERRRSSAHFDG